MSIFSLTRRGLLKSLGVGAGALATTGLGGCSQETPRVDFLHGVASGDPLVDRVILWTRVTPPDPPEALPDGGALEIDWEISEDKGFAGVDAVVASGTVVTSPARDYTVKVDAGGLKPGRRYYYRFIYGDSVSPTGRTRTLPVGKIGAARLVVVSCSSFPHGFFNVYREVSRLSDVDLVVHLGDYIYEYDADSYSSKEAKEKGRLVLPTSELTALEHYRTRHGQYKGDPDLQAAHARHAFITVWDDHEVANDAWVDGAENHNDDEGEWRTRRDAAIQAYMEWMPIRENGDDPAIIYRSFEFGDLASLIMLDTRIIGRDKPISFVDDMIYRSLPFDFTDEDNPVYIADKARRDRLPKDKVKYIPVPFNMKGRKPKALTDYKRIKALDPKKLPDGLAYIADAEAFKRKELNRKGREMLGAAQSAWFVDELKRSTASGRPWQIIGQQLLVGGRLMPDIKDRINPDLPTRLDQGQLDFVDDMHSHEMPLNPDEWLGYGDARTHFLKDMDEHGANCVVLSGDSHDSWAFELYQENSGSVAAVEFGTPGVTSPGLATIFPVDPDTMKIALQEKNPDLKYVGLAEQGYMILDITTDHVNSRWYVVDTVLDRDYKVSLAKSLRARVDELFLEDTEEEG